MDIETPALVFYFNNEGCKSCNANYIETEFDRIKRLTNGKENIKIIILSNFKKFREFYSLSLRFGEDNQINCYNLKNNLFIDNPTIATDLFYFLLNDNHSISSVFLPDYFFEENNTKYFNLVIQKIDNL